MSGSGVQRELTRSKRVEVALWNEQVTRERVEKLEHKERELSARVFRLEQITAPHLNVWYRLRWLITGK